MQLATMNANVIINSGRILRGTEGPWMGAVPVSFEQEATVGTRKGVTTPNTAPALPKDRKRPPRLTSTKYMQGNHRWGSVSSFA